MADETQNQEVQENTPVDNTPASQEPQYTEIEKRAMEQGWVPEDQFTGSGKWRTAEDFIDRGELFAKIDEIKRSNKALEGALQETKQHLKKVRETEYARALSSLKAKKKDALDEGDTSKVVEIDEEIADTKARAAQELTQMDATPQQAAPNPHFVAWVNRNSWYQNDRIMKAAADAIGDELVINGEKNPTRILEEVEKRIRKEFPNRFHNPNREKPGSVEGGGASSRSNRDTFQLTAEETQVMKKLVRHGVMTEKEYIADIRASRGV